MADDHFGMHCVRDAYTSRAQEYISLLGSVQDMDPLDQTLISGWAQGINGPILDAGSGPGHWTDFLRSRGCEIQGLDAVQAFVDSASQRFPATSFSLGDLRSIPLSDDYFSGLLAWYSIIHTDPRHCGALFGEFARVVKPGGELLIGAFCGQQGEEFDHAVVRAYYWSVQGLRSALESAGFSVLETHTRTTRRHRPHVAVLARRND
ncbi:class I SAM-dependent methyltransferase [Glutamicibacter sp.]|uniref:class I SAM-dependent methyltransferase n=1 Tax=Glutamicibacter sp. TaxID=1931995 RepID=UPI0028BF0C02|nr:class I SAM-dependent methyltransferase [Glutamicibacter sp.]